MSSIILMRYSNTVHDHDDCLFDKVHSQHTLPGYAGLQKCTEVHYSCYNSPEDREGLSYYRCGDQEGTGVLTAQSLQQLAQGDGGSSEIDEDARSESCTSFYEDIPWDHCPSNTVETRSKRLCRKFSFGKDGKGLRLRS